MPARPRRGARRLAALAVLALAPLLLPAAAAAAAPAASGEPRVLIALLPLPEADELADAPEPANEVGEVLDRLERFPSLSLGLAQATQGTYDPAQALLDLTQGTRVSLASYEPREPPPVVVEGDGRGGGTVTGWRAIVARAQDAPADLVPGLLAGSVPGGAGYAGVTGREQREAIVAADRAGRIAHLSLGPAADVARRARALLATRRLVVAGLPTGPDGDRAVAQLVSARGPAELLIVLQAPPEANGRLLPTGVEGLAGAPGRLTSDTTHLGGVVAGIDVLPTTLEHLRIAVPDDVKGQPIRVEPGRDAAALEGLADRLRIVLPRRFPALFSVFGAWVALLLAAMLAADRRGLRWAMRAGALGILWVPAVVLVTAALAPPRTAELVLVAVLTLGLGALTDRLLPWPRGPAAPALAALGAYAVDLALGSPLIIRSLLGPNPMFGSRFYGIGNELEATLTALLLIGVAALLTGGGRGRAGVWAFAGAGAALALVMGAGRLGADVGGVITVGAGAAVAAVLMAPGGVTRRALAVVVVAPLLGLLTLAAVDLATGGSSHFTRTVLRAGDGGDLWDVVARRYELAGRQVVRGMMPVTTVIALLAIALGIRRRERVLERVGGDAAWLAALAGIVALGAAGALFNDSGPVLLLFATVIAAVLVVYLRGDARLAEEGRTPR
jgi:hypothetical protein